MSKGLSLDQLSDYINGNIHKIGSVYKEVEEIQVGFNSEYVVWKAEHDVTLERLTERVLALGDGVGPDLQNRIEDRKLEERRLIEDRRQELRETLIPETQAQADSKLAEGATLVEMLRELNPELDKREESLKARRLELEGDLKRLNAEIKKLSGCLGLVVNIFKIFRVDRQRQRVIGQLQSVQLDLRKVRQEWQESRSVQAEEEKRLREEWQELTLEVSRLQGELAYLDEEANRDDLALHRAVRYVIDNLKEPLAAPDEELKAGLDRMIELNIQTDDYHDSLGQVGGLLGFLIGVKEGLKAFLNSVQGLIDEYNMHKPHLPMIHLQVPEPVDSFHRQWEALRAIMVDEARYTKQPAQFLDTVRPLMAENFTDENTQAMFESLGTALERATKVWG